MPASSINLYHMQDTKNNFNAVQLAPICADTDTLMGQRQNYHVSTNCYYGFHSPKSENIEESNDTEMTEIDSKAINTITTFSRLNNSRKRSAEDFDYPQNKRLREAYSDLIGLHIHLKLQQNWITLFLLSHLRAQRDKVRLYFRGYGASSIKLQHMFTASHSQQPRYISLSHEVQSQKYRKPETNEKQISDTRSEDLMETLYWNLHGGNIYQLLQCL